jgi:predicted membrane chloride channel (bestrophin family)
MKRFCILASMTVLGSVGWWIGARIGVTTAVFSSSAASLAGVYLGWRVNRAYFG